MKPTVLIVLAAIVLVFAWLSVVKPAKGHFFGANSWAMGGHKDAATQLNEQESVDDRAISQKIRQAIVDDKDLSLNADNIKITTFNGYVTLKGTVKDQQEKNSIEHKALAVEHVRHVNNQLTIGI